jgi:hypothetical protein
VGLGAILLGLALQWQGSEAKVVGGHLRLDAKHTWVYLTKFSYSKGDGNFTFDAYSQEVSAGARGGISAQLSHWLWLALRTMSTRRPLLTDCACPLQDDVHEGARFYLYLDEDWEEAVAMRECRDKLRLAKWTSSSLRGMFHPIRHTVSQVRAL